MVVSFMNLKNLKFKHRGEILAETRPCIECGAQLSNCCRENAYVTVKPRFATRGFAPAHIPTFPWSPKYYFSWRGTENVHVYFWLLKDLFWNQGYYIPGEVFGSLALVWSFVLTGRAVYYRCVSEFVICLAQMIWLLANNVWMYGELHDLNAMGTWGELYDQCTVIAGSILVGDICLLAFYFMFIRRSTWLKNDRSNPMSLGFNDIGFRPRFPAVFHDWREYEHVHLVFWIIKDIGWTHAISGLWVVFVIPTILVAVDFVYVSMTYKYAFVEHMHYWAYFFWIMANSTWALGDTFFAEGAGNFARVTDIPDSLQNCRWWAGWLFILAAAPLVILYLVWLPATVLGKCQPAADEIEGASEQGSDGEEDGELGGKVGCHSAAVVAYNAYKKDTAMDREVDVLGPGHSTSVIVIPSGDRTKDVDLTAFGEELSFDSDRSNDLAQSSGSPIALASHLV